MNKEQFLKDLHLKWKKRRELLLELSNPDDVEEYECYFKMRIAGSKVEAKLEDILIYIRGINGVTIVRSGETTNRNDIGVYSTKLHIKYTPQTFNPGITLEDIYLFLEKEIRKFSSSISLSRLGKPPGELVTGRKL